MEELNGEELRKMIGGVLKRSITDLSFRRRLLADGNRAMTDAGLGPLPAGITVRFVDNCRKTAKTVVLPDPIESGALSDLDLDQVAGAGCLISHMRTE